MREENMDVVKARRTIVNVLYKLGYGDMYHPEIGIVKDFIKENLELKKENEKLREEIDRLNGLN